MKYNNFDNFTHWYNVHQYHFAHWCAFNMLAMNLGVWKFHHLFHDWYKPWVNDILSIFMGMNKSYSKVHRFHQTHSIHHLEHFYATGKCNWMDLVIDWECSGYTKEHGKLSTREYLNKLISKGDITTDAAVNIKNVLDKYGL